MTEETDHKSDFTAVVKNGVLRFRPDSYLLICGLGKELTCNEEKVIVTSIVLTLQVKILHSTST
jgi:hypothetical protein